MSEKILIQADRHRGIALVSNFFGASGDFLEDEGEVMKRLKNPSTWPFCGVIGASLADKIMKTSWDCPIGDDRFLPSYKKYFRPKPPPMPVGTARTNMKFEILSGSD